MPPAGNRADLFLLFMTFAEHSCPGRASTVHCRLGSFVLSLSKVIMKHDEFPEPKAHDPNEPAWDIDSLKSALTVLTPDCLESTWVSYRIAALANSARVYPDRADVLRRLAIDWASGKLQGRPAPTWTTAGPHGKPRMSLFQPLWERYLSSNYQGRRVTVKSIFFEARKSGWTPGAEAGDAGGLDVTGK